MSGDFPFTWLRHRRTGTHWLSVHGVMVARVVLLDAAPRYGWECGAEAGREPTLLMAKLRAERAWLDRLGRDG